MPKRAHTSLYYADDRDVYDLLEAATRNLPLAKLFDYAKTRGLFLSTQDGRETLVEELSSLTHSWEQLKSMLEATDSPDRNEKKTSKNPPTQDNLEAVERHFQNIRDERSEEWDEVYVINRHEENSMTVTVQYTEMDTRKTRLFQRRMRDITFQVIKSGQGIKIRHEANERANKIAADIIKKLTPPQVESASTEINLSGQRDPVVRTKFFLNLMTKMVGFRLEDVAYLDVDRIADNDAANDEASDEEKAEEKEEENDDKIPSMTAEAIEMKGVVSASLKGEGLLHSPEFIALRDKGFFISHTVWHAIEDKDEGKRVEFQAQFENGAEATGFKYSVRKVYEQFKKGGFKKSHSDVNTIDMDSYESLLEKTASEALISCTQTESDSVIKEDAVTETTTGEG